MRGKTAGRIYSRLGVLALAIALLGPSPGCKSKYSGAQHGGGGGAIITVDGSSTVYPITEAVAEEFQKHNKARVTIGISGSGGGLKKFCAGETMISDASRPITRVEEEACRKNGVRFIELPVGFDGIAIVVNPANDWVDYMTVSELRRLWQKEAQGKITRWSQIRQGWPDKEIHLFGPGVDSGTYDYFTAAIVGKEHSSRGDYTSSEDDNVLVQGVSRDKYALGYFGLAYYEENKDKLKLVPIDDGNDKNGKGPVAPSLETVRNQTYQPLSRPLFIYVSKKAAALTAVKEFVRFYLGNGRRLVQEAGYVPLSDRLYEAALQRFEKGKVGSIFSGGSKIGVTVEDLLEHE